MNQKLVTIVFLGSTVLMMAFQGVAQKNETKEEKHIKIVKTENGKIVELDTIITSGKPFIWMGDTIGKGKEFKWVPRKGVKLDSLHQNFDKTFEYEIVEDNGGVIILKSSKASKPRIYKFSTEGDSGKEVRIFRRSGVDSKLPMDHSGRQERIIRKESKGDEGWSPTPPPPPPDVNFMRLKAPQKSNVIDLSDPGIISYEKKKLSGGREKITIIRNEIKEVDNEDIKVIREGGKMIKISEDKISNGKKVKVEVETEEIKK